MYGQLKFLGVCYELLRLGRRRLKGEKRYNPPANMTLLVSRSKDGQDSGFLPSTLSVPLASRTFERAPTLRRLLTYLWEHRDETLSEYRIATEALSRQSTFDPDIDASVRVLISRLRQRLAKYYEEEGSAETERIVIPRGSHQLRLEPAPPAPIREPARVDQNSTIGSSVSTRRSPVVTYLTFACAILLAICIGLTVALVLHRSPAAGLKVQPAPSFWTTFFGNARPTRIIVPTPLFFSFTPQAGNPWGTIMFRDTEVNDFSSRDRSSRYRTVAGMFGSPHLASNYTVSSDTFAAVRLARYLDRVGLSTTVVSATDAPLEALDAENVIALGTWGTLSPLQPYLDRLDYVLASHETSVEVRHPLPGEPKSTRLVEESAERSIWPGVIAVLPGRDGHTHLIVLASRHTSALVSLLTSNQGLEELGQLWKAKGSPEYYEAIISAEMDGTKLVRCWPVALRPFRP